MGRSVALFRIREEAGRLECSAPPTAAGGRTKRRSVCREACRGALRGSPPQNRGGGGRSERSKADEAPPCRAYAGHGPLRAVACKKPESSAGGDLADRARHAKDSSDLVMHWVRQAARYRSVAARNKVGDHV